MSKSRILKEIYDTARSLQDIGAISTVTMREYDRLCFPPVHDFSFKEIKKLRERENISQAVFAALLNTNVSTVQKWEIGKKKPSGMALKLLNIVERKGIDAII